MSDQKGQAEELMGELVPFAKKMLKEHQGFHPFGGYLDVSGKVVHVGVKPSSLNATASDKVKILVESFKELASRKKATACAIVTDVLLPHENGKKGDAIKLFIEHRKGYCAEVFIRYELVKGMLEFTETFAQQGDPMLFVE